MCSAHQPGSVSRYSMAVVILLVLLLFLGAAITGTCSLSTEGNLLRHTAPPSSRPHASLSAPASSAMAAMPGMHHAACADPACPMHRQHSRQPGSTHPALPEHCVSALCGQSLPPSLTPVSVVALSAPLVPQTSTAFPEAPLTRTAWVRSSLPPLSVPRSARPAALRI